MVKMVNFILKKKSPGGSSNPPQPQLHSRLMRPWLPRGQKGGWTTVQGGIFYASRPLVSSPDSRRPQRETPSSPLLM